MNNVVGKVLERFRKKANLTIQDVAGELKIDCTLLTEWESGEKTPSNYFKSALSILYSIPFNYLTYKDHPGYIQARISDHNTLDDVDEFILQNRFENISFFIELFKTNSMASSKSFPRFYKLPTNVVNDNGCLSASTKDIILKNTKLMRDFFNLPLTASVGDPIEKLQALALNILFIDLPDTLNGISFTLPQEGRFLIFVNSKDSYIKQCFTTIHELGHIVFHFEDKNRRTLINEQIANCFANMFLFPQEEVKSRFSGFTLEKFSDWVVDFREVSKEYFISYKTIAYALYHADIIRKTDAETTLPDLFIGHKMGKAYCTKGGISENKSFDNKLKNLVDENLLSEAKVRELTYNTMHIN